MRILFVHDRGDDRGGAGVYLNALARDLLMQGHEVHVAVGRGQVKDETANQRICESRSDRCAPGGSHPIFADPVYAFYVAGSTSSGKAIWQALISDRIRSDDCDGIKINGH